MRTVLLACFACVCLAACSGSGSDPMDPMDPPEPIDDTYLCGIGPGEPGNEIGVGRYCDGFADCAGQAASICAVAGNADAHFCTKLCDPARPIADQCGDNALCECEGSQCGCTPASCGE